MSNVPEKQRPKFSVMIQTDMYKNLINNTLQDPKRAQRFIASISSAVAVNPELQKCDAGTVLSAALLGESLELSPSPQLGQYYLVPFEDNKNNRTVATFIMGYKGYLQLAIRSNYYKKIIVTAIKKGELVYFDMITEDIKLNIIQDEAEREAAETVGYYAMFEYLSGFRKAIYWSKDKMVNHADRYSPAFSKAAKKGKESKYDKVSFADFSAGKVPQSKMWLYSSFWYKDFDTMAYKTMIRQLISKWGIMSVELRQAFEADDAVINNEFVPEYVTNDDTPPESPPPLDTPGGDGSEAQTTIPLSEIK